MKKRIICLIIAFASVFMFSLQMTAADSSVMNARKSVVRLLAMENGKPAWIGSAFAIGAAGKAPQYFITCDHCVSGDVGEPVSNDLQIWLVLNNTQDTDTDIPCSVVYCTHQLHDGPDFAIIKAKKPVPDRVPIQFQTKENVSVSDQVFAIGFPAAADSAYALPSTIDDMTVTSGIISKRSISEGSWNANYQTDVAINNGNSGGPLVDKNGAAIGICAFGETNAQNINGAVQIDNAMQILKSYNIHYALYKPTSTGFNLFDFLRKNLIVVIIIGVAAIALIIALIIILTLKKSSSKPLSNTTPANPNPEAAAQERAKKPILFSTGALYPGQEISISGEPLIIGRDPKRCNLVVDPKTPGISSAHCQISYSGGNFIIKDLGSTYGTFLPDGAKLSPNQEQIIGVNAAFYLAEKQNSFMTKLL